ALVLVAFALGLLSKAMVVTLPLVLLLLDYWPPGRIRIDGRRWVVPPAVLLEKLPLLVLAGALSVVTFVVQLHGRTMGDVGRLPIGARVANALASYLAYLRLTVWPTGLALPYPYHPVPLSQAVLAAIVLIGLTAVVLGMLRARPYLAV